MTQLQKKRVLVVGAGLAGADLSFYLASRGIPVVLAECKGQKLGPAQKIPTFAELVCTNSLKSISPEAPHGMLKREMKALGSLVLEVAETCAVPAGEALAVDREVFSQKITARLKEHPLITVIEAEITDPMIAKEKYDCELVVLATGPLTTTSLGEWLQQQLSPGDFYFYDAIAPVVDAESLDYSKLYFKDRHRPLGESADYLNAPMNQEEYTRFVEELCKGEKVPPKDFEEERFFEACLPIDLMAERGPETARFSCMRPLGLEEASGKRPYAVVQLRKENLLGSAYNLVGFQTRLTYKEQVRIFRLIPGLENAQFLHLGSVHRNSFLNARVLLAADLSSKKFPELYFAGQITGVEGYTESASMGLYVGFQIERRLKGLPPLAWPVDTCIGALINYLMTAPHPVPSNINLGLLPAPEVSRELRKLKGKKKAKRGLVSERASLVLKDFLQGHQDQIQ